MFSHCEQALTPHTTSYCEPALTPHTTVCARDSPLSVTCPAGAKHAQGQSSVKKIPYIFADSMQTHSRSTKG